MILWGGEPDGTRLLIAQVTERASAVQDLPVDQIHQLDCDQHAAKPTTKALKMIQVDDAKYRMGKEVGDSIDK